MTTNRCLSGMLLLLLALPACSGSSGGGNDDEGKLEEDAVCKFAGAIECGENLDGDDAVLVCTVTPDKGRVWVVQQVCHAGCEAKACLPEPVDDSVDATDVVEEIDTTPPCIPDCDGKACGDDGCGGQCALCPPDFACTKEFKCKLTCSPKCENKQCGPDGCGGTCGDCPFGMQCKDGMCACNPQCGGKECGPDGCGGTCGTCPAGLFCSPQFTCTAA